MARRVLNVLTVLSLLLCVAVAVLSVRGHRRYDYVKYVGPRWASTAISDRGLLIFGRYDKRNDWNVPGGIGGGWSVLSLGGPNRAIHFYSAKRYPKPWYRFGLHPPRRLPSLRYGDAAVPNWALCLLAAALPANWLLRALRRTRRLRASLCPQCGYDLRATPGRCPECGTSGAAPIGLPR